MCGRYALVVVGDGSLQRRFSLEEFLPDVRPRYNVAPTQTLPVVVRNSPDRVEMMRWGLIPSWAKDASIGSRMINARAETVAEKPAFRRPLRSQRCLVPATGFFEWKREGGGRTPFYFRLRDDALFAFAGLWDVWTNPEGRGEVHSYTIITCPANAVVAPIHDRMPVMLEREAEEAWLDPESSDPKELLPFLHPYPADQMTGHRVGGRVNSVKNDAPELIAPVASPALPDAARNSA